MKCAVWGCCLTRQPRQYGSDSTVLPGIGHGLSSNTHRVRSLGVLVHQPCATGCGHRETITGAQWPEQQVDMVDGADDVRRWCFPMLGPLRTATREVAATSLHYTPAILATGVPAAQGARDGPR